MGDTRATVTLAANLDPSGVLSAVKAMQGAFNNLKLPNNIGEGLDKSLSKATDLLKKYQGQLAKGINTKTDAKNITKTGAQINEVLDEISHYINDLNGQQIFLKADVGGLNKLQTSIENARTAWKNAIQEFRKDSDIDKILGGIGEKTTRSNLTQGSISKAKTLFDKGDLEGYKNALDEIYSRLSKLKDTTISNVTKNLGLEDAGSKSANLEQIKRQLEAISKIDFSSDANVKAQFDEITNTVNAYETEVKRAGNAGQEAFNNINASSAVSNTRALVNATDQYTNSVMSAKDQVQDLQRSTQYFFSLRNMLNLLKRGIDDAIQSVKELDAAMTETAVVTDYKVSDLWGMLPQYTQLANQLGATTQGAYETMTLYFQQGLDQQQAFEIGAETMKMARIAGLDYAETTDMMTAALRGFNMELNETSAKRINDVYSELAAITASDTEELGTAMQRTASIAHSAGMSFEGTTAFLAQAIETTREPAENIGTAMKTIVARFQEMKENPLEISEVDGEEVDYNKVDAALQSIGVSLKDTNGQFRELDQVFLDISSRWDGLSQTQQRYIATVAAGSRQQSRFIAMMDNYDRTMQLFEAANNSAGASDEQFGKTMDSLESKLNKLHNAWQQFTMGIANNSMIKLAVDGMTGLLTVTNKLIDAFSLGFGPLKSFLSVFTAFTGLKVAGRAANSLIGGLGGLVDPQSTVKEGLKIGLFGQGKTNAQAQAITTPIVGTLNKISGQIAQIKNGGINNKGQSGSEIKNTSKQEYLGVKKQFDKLSWRKGFTMDEASGLFGQLDTKHQQAMFNNSPGTKIAMKKASMAWLDSKGLSKELTDEGKQYINSIYKGMQEGTIPVNKGVELIGQPQKWGQYLGQNVSTEFLKSFTKESSSQAHQKAMSYLMHNAEDYGFQTDEFKNWYKNASKEQQEAYNRYFKQEREKGGIGSAQGTVSNMGRLANDIGSIGDKFTQAGYGITTFGNALSQLGGPIGAVGTGIAALGGTISSMGMMVSGATGLITVFSEGIEVAGTSIAISGGAIAAVVAPLAAAAAAFLLVRAHIKKVKEAGEEVTKTFNDTNKEVEGNISKLKSYQSEFATLAQGVDSNGNNVSLDDSQYQRYLEIVDDIAKINPEIVQGYNAQGHAIIDNNKALDETLKKQQQIKKATLDTYTKTGSLQKLINARNVNSDYKGIRVKGSTPGVYDGSGHGNEGRQTPIGLGSDVFKIADELRLIRTKDDLGKTLKVDDKMLQKYGIESMDALISGEEQAVKNFIKHRDKIQAELTNSGFELSDSLIKGFDKLNEDQKAFDEAIQPVYDNLLASVSNSPFYEEIGSEFKSAIALGLKDIASQDLNASEMQEQANSLVQEFDNLTRAGGEYATAMEQVEGAQDKFAASLDASEYAKNTEGALNTLNSLLKEYEGNTTAYGQAVTEYLTNQIEKIKNFTQEGTVSLTEALNGMTNTISAAEGSYEAFQDATKTDMSTGADNMKSIFEEITKETDGVQLHMERFGDNTMWEGARALLGDEFVEKNAGNVDKVKKEILSLKDELQDGEKGFAAFWKNFQKVDASKIEGFQWNKDGSYNIDRDINPDAYKEIAEQMHRSEQYVVSMLNKGRQFADINFTNIEDVRKALSTDSSAIKGSSTSTITNDQGKQETVTDIFVKEDYLKNAVREAVGSNPAEQKEAIDNITKNGVKIIPGPNDITKKDFKNMGITDLPSLIRTLGDTGQFNRSEVEEYAQQMSGYDAGEFDTVYKDYLDSQDHPELPSINSIDSNVASILGLIAHERGQLTQEDKEAYDKAKQDTIGELGVADTIPQLFAKGLNKNGEKLSKDEFNQTQKNLDKQAEAYDKAEAFYTNLAQKAEKAGDTDAEKEAQKYADDYKKWAQDIRDYQQSGIEKYKKDQERERAPIPGKDSNTTSQEERIKTIEANNKKEKELLEKHNKEKAAINQAYTTKEKEDLKAYIQNQQHERQNYEQQAQNASGPTEGLVEKDSTYKPYALNSVSTEISHLLSEKTDDIFKAINPIDAVKKALDSQLASSEIQQQGFVIDEKYAAYAGQANEAFINEIKTGAIKLGNFIKEGYDSLTQAEDSIPNQETTFVTKVTTSAQKLGEALKKGWDSLQNNTPAEPATQSVPTINKGTATVANIAQEVVQNVSTKEKGVDETQQKLDKISSTADKGATMPVSAAVSATVNAAQTALQNLQNKASKGASVKTTVDSKGADNARSAASKVAEMPLKIRDLATPVINKINASARQSVTKTVNISPNYTGTWRKDVYIGKTGPGANAYTGVNNKISFHHVPMAGSLARGTKKGRVGPRNQGGLTLTGEEGYEIAWIPSESRSAILGASGPEMINLPKEAIVYNHDQSKEIMKKRKSISAGSMDSGSYKPAASTTTTTSTSFSSSGNPTKQIVDNAKKTGDKVSKDVENTTKAIARVTVWWENHARKAEGIQRRTEKNQNEYEKYLKDLKATLRKTGTTGQGNAFIINNEAYISEQQTQYNKAKDELSQIATGKWQSGKKAGKKATSKKNKKKKKKKNQVAYEQGADNILQVSYEGKNSKGKKTTKTSYVNTAGYVYWDEATSSYQIDQNKLKKIKNKDKRRQVADALNKEINDRTSKRNSAEDNIRKAQEALEKFSEELYNTFFAWENELTEIWNITQKIEQAQSRISGRDAFDDLINKQLSTGMMKGDDNSRALSLTNFKERLALQNQALQDRQEAITASKDALQRLLTSEDERTTLTNVNNKLNANTQAAQKASKLTKLNEAKKAQKNYKEAVAQKKYAESLANKYQARMSKLSKKKKLSKKEQGELKSLRQQWSYQKAQAKRYDKAIKDNKTLAGQVDKLQKEYNSMASGATLNETQRLGYQQYQKELEDQIKAQDMARKFTKITKRADGTIDIRFDTTAFENERLNGNITNDMAKAVQDWVKKIQEASADLQKNYEDLTKEITDYYSQLDSLQDEWADYGKELTDITESYEKQKIDKIKQLADSVKKALDKLLTEVKQKLDERRKQEENAKTERDISQKQQRLSMLRADTAGGHQVEIAQLEKEIAEAQRNYQISLEDQLLDKLQQQADLASEQRERQIELQEALASSVNNIAQVNEWMRRATSIGAIEDEDERAAAYDELKEEIREGYYANKNYDIVTEAEQIDIESEFEQFFNGLISNQEKQQQIIDTINQLEPLVKDIRDLIRKQWLTLDTAKEGGMTIRESEQQFGASLGQLRTEGKYTFDDFKQAGYTNQQIKQAGFGASEFKSKNVSYTDAKAAGYNLDELEKGGYTEATAEKQIIAKEQAARAEAARIAAQREAQRKAEEQQKAAEAAEAARRRRQTFMRMYYSALGAYKGNKKISSADIGNLFSLGQQFGLGKASVLQHIVGGAGADPFTWKNTIKAILGAPGIDRWNLLRTFPNNSSLEEALVAYTKKKLSEIKSGKDWENSKALAFKTGGMADFTGPAWLDGTPSKPELVLNAQDTKNFIALKDVLSKAIGSTSHIENSYGGDANFEININVDHISSDYDVNKVVDQVEKRIVQKSGYRNVTQVRNFR